MLKEVQRQAREWHADLARWRSDGDKLVEHSIHGAIQLQRAKLRELHGKNESIIGKHRLVLEQRLAEICRLREELEKRMAEPELELQMRLAGVIEMVKICKISSDCQSRLQLEKEDVQCKEHSDGPDGDAIFDATTQEETLSRSEFSSKALESILHGRDPWAGFDLMSETASPRVSSRHDARGLSPRQVADVDHQSSLVSKPQQSKSTVIGGSPPQWLADDTMFQSLPSVPIPPLPLHEAGLSNGLSEQQKPRVSAPKKEEENSVTAALRERLRKLAEDEKRWNALFSGDEVHDKLSPRDTSSRTYPYQTLQHQVESRASSSGNTPRR